MKLLAFSLFDTKASFFNPPFFFAHHGQAVRACIDLGSDLNTQVGRYPNDFSLFEVGTFDDQTGMFEARPPLSLGLVSQFLPRQEPLFAPPADAGQPLADAKGIAWAKGE